MARGAVSKETVANTILATFPGAFKYEKEIRIPIMEDGEIVQIKVTLTAAKTNVEAGGDTAIPGSFKTPMGASAFPVSDTSNTTTKQPETIQPTAEEKQNIASLLSMLGL